MGSNFPSIIGCALEFVDWNENSQTSFAPHIYAAQPRERTLSVVTMNHVTSATLLASGADIDIGKEFFPGQTSPSHEGLWFYEFANGFFAMDRLVVIRLLMVALLALFFFVAFRKPQLVPRGIQNVGEMFMDFVRVNIAEDILGKKNGRRFLPVIASIFFVILVTNLPSVIPGMNISPNGRIAMPLVLAVVAYITFVYAGVKEYGFFRFFKASLIIPGLPKLIYVLTIPIELFSTFVLRPITLSIRLMANMLAGHIVLVLLFGSMNMFFWNGTAGGFALTGLIGVGSVLFTLFEVMVIFLQAYIFSLLATVYIDLSLHAEEH